MRMRRLAALPAAALLVLSVAACGYAPRVCPAIGWTNLLRVQVTGAVDRVADIAYCAGARCTPRPAPSPGTATGTSVGRDPGTEQGSHPLYTTTRDGDTWKLVTDMGQPDRGRVAALDASGAIIVDRELALHWVRVGGTAACGGPAEAEVTLDVA